MYEIETMKKLFLSLVNYGVSRMLLIGMNTNLTKKPMKPITAKPTEHAPAIFKYSKYKLPFLSGLLQRFKSLRLSFANSFRSEILELTKFGLSDIFL